MYIFFYNDLLYLVKMDLLLLLLKYELFLDEYVMEFLDHIYENYYFELVNLNHVHYAILVILISKNHNISNVSTQK